MKKAMSLIALLLAVVFAALPMTGCQSAEKRELVIFTWADYFPEDILAEFEEATGIDVIYTFFDSNEEMLAKLEAAKGGEYDMVLASDYIIDIAIEQGLVGELDKDQIPNFKDIDPAFQNTYYDPDNTYTVPFAAGTPLIIYDPAKVDVDIKGYEDLWNPALANSIVMMDDARNVVGITLKTMGYSLNEEDLDVLAQAEEKLMTLKPNIRALDYSTPYELMISGEATVGYMFTPQVLWALGERPDLKVVYPAEGMGFGIDACFVPSQAPNADEAYEFLNYILDGEVSARLSAWTMYMNCVSTAKEYMSEADLNNEALYIPAEILGEAEFMQPVSNEATAKHDEIWTRFKQS